MSAQALIWAANVRGLKPATKIVLIQLSERHNKDTGLCNPSIRQLADDCEMDRTTVMRHIEILIALGLLSRSTSGKEDGGRANNEYELHMPKPVQTDVSGGVKSQIPTGVKSHSDGGLSRIPTGVKSHSCATLTLREPKEREPTLFGSNEPQRTRDDDATKAAEDFDAFWAEYPKCPRKTDRVKAKSAFVAIVTGKHRTIDKTSAERITAAAASYAQTDPDPQFVPMPTTWLNGARWEAFDAPKPKDTSGPWWEVVR